MNKAPEPIKKEDKVQNEGKLLRPLLAIATTLAATATIPIAIHVNFPNTPPPPSPSLVVSVPSPSPPLVVSVPSLFPTPVVSASPSTSTLGSTLPSASNFNQEEFAKIIETMKAQLSQQPLTRSNFKKADDANWQAFYLLLGKPLHEASPKEVASLSCDALRSIDNAWKAAEGYELGIGVQASIFEEVGSNYDLWKEEVKWTHFGVDTQFIDVHEPSIALISLVQYSSSSG